MKIDILCAGHRLAKEEEAWVGRYLKRLTPYSSVSILRVREAEGPTPHARAEATWKEFQRKTPKSSRTFLLDPRGKNLSTEDFARLIADSIERSAKKRLVFYIGGSYGLDPQAQNEVDQMISLSPLTLPHRIALLILVEQLYRVFSWRNGAPYHHS